MERVPIDRNSSSLDFRASADEAWYTVHLVLQEEALIVKYYNFTDAFDERFEAAYLKDPHELDNFIKRFRPSAVQLQDNQCRNVIEGMTLCASYVFGNNEVKFYDAVVMAVNHKDHEFEKEEVCTCTFVLFWVSGPNAGNITQTSVEQICLLQSGDAQMDPTLFLFVKICREKHMVVSRNSASYSECDVLMGDILSSHNTTPESIINNNFRPPYHESHAFSTKDVKSYKQSRSLVRTFKGQTTDHWGKSGHDITLGGKSSLVRDLGESFTFHFMLIENLDKNLSPLTIVDFLKKHVSITCQALVFPSPSFEAYTKGIIVVDSQKELSKLSDFLHNPSHMILSTRGIPWVINEKKSDFLDNPSHMILTSRERPWVITEKKLRCGAVGATIGKLTMLPESRPWDKNTEVADKIRIVSCGTEEYERGLLLKDLYLEFADHVLGLNQQFSLEEGKIMQQL